VAVLETSSSSSEALHDTGLNDSCYKPTLIVNNWLLCRYLWFSLNPFRYEIKITTENCSFNITCKGITGALQEYLCTFMISHSVLLKMRKFSDKRYRENQNTFLRSIIFSKNLAVYEEMWKKYGRTRQATDGNMAHALCMLCNIGYIRTFIIWNTHCFSTATRVTQNISMLRLYKHCLSWCTVTLSSLEDQNLLRYNAMLTGR